MISMDIIDRDDECRSIQVVEGGSVMEALRENDFEVEGTCGGSGSCGSCHVYLGQEWMEKIGVGGEFEMQTVEGLMHGNDNSRLCCQLEVNSDLEGLTLTLAPAEF